MADPEPVVPWQLRKGRNTDKKLDQVIRHLKAAGARSVLDIGCNAGEITRGLGEAGLFAVGIEQEINFSGVADPLRGACLGNIRFSQEVAESLPTFDAATVLSVHHHFIREIGDEAAKRLIQTLGMRVQKLIVFEVSSKSQEYGAESDALFRNEDEADIVAFTTRWMADALPGWRTDYVWRNVRRPRLSDRFMFTVAR